MLSEACWVQVDADPDLECSELFGLWFPWKRMDRWVRSIQGHCWNPCKLFTARYNQDNEEEQKYFTVFDNNQFCGVHWCYKLMSLCCPKTILLLKKKLTHSITNSSWHAAGMLHADEDISAVQLESSSLTQPAVNVTWSNAAVLFLSHYKSKDLFTSRADDMWASSTETSGLRSILLLHSGQQSELSFLRKLLGAAPVRRPEAAL